MAWYSAGTIQVAANGTVATGTGTAFLGNVRVGDGITIAGSTAQHEVVGVTSNTQLTFSPAYAGTTGSGKAYRIVPVNGYDKDLSDAFNAIRLTWGTQLSSLQPWAYAPTVGQARNELQLGSAALLTAQANANDSTPGRAVITQGAGFASRANFGVYYSASAGANIDNAPAGEAALYSNANAGTFPPVAGIAFWWVETQATFSGASKVQRAYDYTSSGATTGVHCFRTCSNAGVWSPWRVVFSNGNILGTVSQSAGVPTGAIIERGSNANGEYVRYADGTQICWLGFASAEAGLRVANVSAGATGTVIWGFPAAFASTPEVTADWGSHDGSIRVNGQPQRKSNRSTTQCPINWQALQALGGTASQLDAVAIGRWF